MPKDLQELITKANKGLGKKEDIDVDVKREDIDEPKEMVAKQASSDYPESTPDELVLKHANELKQQELLKDQDRRVKEGMTVLLSAADSIASAERCREDLS